MGTYSNFLLPKKVSCSQCRTLNDTHEWIHWEEKETHNTSKTKRGEQKSAQPKALTDATSGETKARTSNHSLHLTSSKTVEGLGEGIWRVLVHTHTHTHKSKE
jgi:phage FluMu protein Com